MVKRLLQRLRDSSLLESLFHKETNINYDSPRAHSDSTRTMKFLQAVLNEFTSADHHCLDWQQCTGLAEVVFDDLTGNIADLCQLIRVKDRLVSKLRRPSASKRSSRQVALQKLECNFEANFSQRELLLSMTERLVSSLFLLMIQMKVNDSNAGRKFEANGPRCLDHNTASYYEAAI